MQRGGCRVEDAERRMGRNGSRDGCGQGNGSNFKVR